jgi:hypothetical protein
MREEKERQRKRGSEREELKERETVRRERGSEIEADRRKTRER